MDDVLILENDDVPAEPVRDRRWRFRRSLPVHAVDPLRHRPGASFVLLSDAERPGQWSKCPRPLAARDRSRRADFDGRVPQGLVSEVKGDPGPSCVDGDVELVAFGGGEVLEPGVQRLRELLFVQLEVREIVPDAFDFVRSGPAEGHARLEVALQRFSMHGRPGADHRDEDEEEQEGPGARSGELAPGPLLSHEAGSHRENAGGVLRAPGERHSRQGRCVHLASPPGARKRPPRRSAAGLAPNRFRTPCGPGG